VRIRFWSRLTLALVMAAALSLVLVRQDSGSASGTDGHGDFIIRCFYNADVATEDPIEEPGSFNTDHLHMFFGNLASGGAATNGSGTVAFPNMQSGDEGGTATMEDNGLTPATNCQDDKDTAGYWVPESFMTTPSGTATAWLPGGGCRTTTCSTSKNLYMRVYYVPHGSATNQEIPDGTIMIAGYPAGCANVDGTEPDGCKAGGPSYPNDLNIVQYTCGANTAAGLSTPSSAWPYDCKNYLDADDTFSDGEVAHTLFPDCWNGKASFPAPNSPVNAQGLPTDMVPGYVAPWIPYTAWENYPGLTSRPANDLSYGKCTAGTPVVQLEERIHLLNYGKGWGEPSTCGAWNTAANAENSPSGGTTPNDNDEMVNGKPHNDGDATVQVGTTSSGEAIWGFHKCVAAKAPSPKTGVSTLSFACSQGADPNCTDNIGIPSTTTGCGAAGSDCYVGAYPDGWETLHADYWQTWQEAQHPLDSVNGFDAPGDAGTFGDVVEDCVQGTGPHCSSTFITNTSPPQVYGKNGNNP
jgi:Domain of unknown function (DUF1996)